jgi:hypothetical protein
MALQMPMTGIGVNKRNRRKIRDYDKGDNFYQDRSGEKRWLFQTTRLHETPRAFSEKWDKRA